MRIGLVYLGRENPELEYLSAALKAAGHTIDFIYDPGSFSRVDNVLYSPALEKRYSRRAMLIEQVRTRPPDLLYFFVYNTSFRWSLELAAEFRALCDAPIVFGGRHPTFAPDAVMSRDVVDIVVEGEGEETAPEMAAAIESGSNLETVSGLYFRRNGKVIYSGLRPPIEDLDALPFPDKSLFDREISPADDYNIWIGRGCPGRCTFCQEGILRRKYGAKVFRRRSIDNIIAELSEMKKRYDFRHVFISDPVFFTPKRWVLDLLKKYKREIGVPFRCYGQLRHLDEEVAWALKDAGCYGAEFGFQTANDYVRREILDRAETTQDAKDTFAVCDRVRLRYDVDHIFGLPGESDPDFVDAARIYANATYLNRVKVHMLVYFPGAPILETAQSMGLADEEDFRRAQEGEAGDICRVGSVQWDQTEKRVREWKNFYKLMPLLPSKWAHKFIDRGWNRYFDRLPGPVVMLLQILVAIRGGDRRFWIYIKYIAFRIRRHRELIGGGKS